MRLRDGCFPQGKLADVHMFLATGEAKKKNEFGCPEGELHSLLIFSRQRGGAASDEKLARRGAAYAGWRRVIFERSAQLPTRPADPNLSAAYEDALTLGCSVIADRRALTPRPRKRDRRAKKQEA